MVTGEARAISRGSITPARGFLSRLCRLVAKIPAFKLTFRRAKATIVLVSPAPAQISLIFPLAQGLGFRGSTLMVSSKAGYGAFVRVRSMVAGLDFQPLLKALAIQGGFIFLSKDGVSVSPVGGAIGGATERPREGPPTPVATVVRVSPTCRIFSADNDQSCAQVRIADHTLSR